MKVQSPRRTAIIAVVFLLLTLLFIGIQPKTYSFNGHIMGTTYNISYVSSPFGHSVSAASKVVHETLVDIDNRMSTYKPNSELMQFNRAPVGEPFRISDDIIYLVQLAQRISEMSDGAYDITIGPLVNLWGFGPTTEVGNENIKKNNDSSIHNTDPKFLKWLENSHPAHIPNENEIELARSKVWISIFNGRI